MTEVTTSLTRADKREGLPERTAEPVEAVH